MKKRALAIFIIFVFLLTTMTACSKTQDQINQVKDDFNTLVTDVATFSIDLATAALSGVDITPIMNSLQEVTDFINKFVIATLNEASSTVLNGIITQIQGMQTILTNLKTQLSDLLSGGGGDVSTENAQEILAEVAEVKMTLMEVKSMIENIEETPVSE
jgi:hypothetical protein